jgi:hypothetical protein
VAWPSRTPMIPASRRALMPLTGGRVAWS